MVEEVTLSDSDSCDLDVSAPAARVSTLYFSPAILFFRDRSFYRVAVGTMHRQVLHSTEVS